MAAGPRVVLDTNVLVAAVYNVASASRRIVEACLDGGLTSVLSPALRREYQEGVGRRYRSFQMLAGLLRVARITRVGHVRDR